MKRNLPRRTRGIAPARFRDNDEEEEAGPSNCARLSTPSAGSARPSTPSTSPRPGLAPPGTPPALLPFSPVRALGGRRKTRGRRRQLAVPVDMPDLTESEHDDDSSDNEEEEDFRADNVNVNEFGGHVDNVREVAVVPLLHGHADQGVGGAVADGQQDRPSPPV
jgi:hypothetical protein